GRARQDGRSANARRPFPHDRRPYLDLEPLHRTPKRTEDALAAIEPRVASAAAAQDHRGRRYRRLRQIRHVVETFWVQGAILRAFPGLQAPSRESWAKSCETMNAPAKAGELPSHSLDWSLQTCSCLPARQRPKNFPDRPLRGVFGGQRPATSS